MMTSAMFLFLIGITVVFIQGQSTVRASRILLENEWPSPKLRDVKTLSFASYYSNHMVLQKAPKRATIWGYSPFIGENITLKMSGRDSYVTKVYEDHIHKVGLWKVKLRPESGRGPFTITVISNEMTIALSDVMFGDVWVCSGQSNMAFTVGESFNASKEIADANNYPDIRLFTVADLVAPKPVWDLNGITQPWSRASNDSVHGQTKYNSYFSAVCWFYGKALYKELGYPIGLITTAWGGTQIETWSSPDALAQCGLGNQSSEKYVFWRYDGVIDVPTTPSCLWNGMVHPLINMTIYGVIWYQGEANTDVHTDKYNCTFPAMIDDWRVKFHNGSDGETDALFPFGFVQLGPNRINSEALGYPEIRWHQTADYGFVPNPRMKNVFMSVAVDLTDFASPFGGVHIRDKQDVAARLTLSGLHVAYNRTGILFQGPFPSHIKEGSNNISLVYTSNIKYRNLIGFEARCDVSSKEVFWTEIPVLTPVLPDTIVLWSGVCGEGETISGLRYLWQESPCAFKTCTVYSANNPLLPGPPFVLYIQMTNVEGTVHWIDVSSPPAV